MEIVEDPAPCNWGMRYRSVVGFGTAAIIDSKREKAQALSIIMRHYSTKVFTFPEEMAAGTTVVKIAVEMMTGKQSGFPKDNP